jgi:sulfur-oxidizing protein SoxZ
MADNMKIRAQRKEHFTEVKLLMSHPMETGRRKNDAGDVVPAHFVQQVTAMLNDKMVLESQWGTGISKNPYLTFRLKNAQLGDKLTITWLDNLGETVTQSVMVVQG